nr:hydantoinase B/oxoprolinase family protein [Gammaproteobacteria bacterium]
MSANPRNRDPIAFELFKNALASIADEMAVTICRTTYSGVLRDNMDFSTAFADAHGRVVAQGLTLPGHLGSIPTALQTVIERYGDEMQDGDVYAMNDPFDGGMHLPDIFVFKPIYKDGERLAIAATVCHHADVGGRVPGSNASDSTEIYQEGLRIPALKLYEAGVQNKTLWTLIEKNVRIPVQVFGDLRAQLAACHIAEREFVNLVEEYGVLEAKAHMDELIEYTERLTRAAISELPDGRWSFEDWIDDDGIDRGTRIRLFCTITKSGDSVHVDWDGSSAQVKGAINSTLSFTKSHCYAAINTVLPMSIPCNEGMFRAIEVSSPEGTITNMVHPGACAARGLTGFRMGDCLFGALAKMLPDRVGASSDGGNTGISIGGYDDARKPFVFVDFACGTWGGRPWADGLQGNANMFANMASQSCEVIEAEYPLEVLAYEFVGDKAGAGQYRGGMPYRRTYRFGEREGILQVRSDRRDVRPYGLYGGRAGQASANTLNPGVQGEQALPSKFLHDIARGDVFQTELAGGGGWGDPLLREPEAVLADV